MSILINYKNNSSEKNSPNIVLFVDEKYNISTLKKKLSASEYKFIHDLLKIKDLKKKIITFDINSKRKIILVSIKKNITPSDLENLGAKFYDLFKNLKEKKYNISSDTFSSISKITIGYFLHGIKLKSYSFDKYKSKKNNKNISINVSGKNIPTFKDQLKFKALAEGTFYTRDLVSEPGNVLHPD